MIERCTAVIVFTLSLAAARAYAHDAALAPPWSALGWTSNPWLGLALALSATGYIVGDLRCASHARSQRRLWFERTAFVLAWVAILAALVSPIDRMSDITFWAHMLQHEALMLLAAPLLALSKPFHRYLWALPKPARRALTGTLQTRALRSFGSLVSAPAVALALHALARWLWHIPLLFEAALANETVHGLQHAMFFFTALLFWWSLVHGRYGRLGYGVACLFVFATALHTGALGVLLTLAPAPWYGSYAARGAPFGIDPLADQELAGLVMWVGAGTYLAVIGLALFAAWLGEAERRHARTSLVRLSASGPPARP